MNSQDSGIQTSISGVLRFSRDCKRKELGCCFPIATFKHQKVYPLGLQHAFCCHVIHALHCLVRIIASHSLDQARKATFIPPWYPLSAKFPLRKPAFALQMVEENSKGPIMASPDKAITLSRRAIARCNGRRMTLIRHRKRSNPGNCVPSGYDGVALLAGALHFAAYGSRDLESCLADPTLSTK